jgi:hypothetical protein
VILGSCGRVLLIRARVEVRYAKTFTLQTWVEGGLGGMLSALSVKIVESAHTERQSQRDV